MDATDLNPQSVTSHQASQDAIEGDHPSPKSLTDMLKEIKTMIYTLLVPEQHPIVGHKCLMPPTVIPLCLINKEMMLDVTTTYFENTQFILKNLRDPQNLYYKTLVYCRRLHLSDVAQVHHLLQDHSCKGFAWSLKDLPTQFPLLKSLVILTGREMRLDSQAEPLTIDTDNNRMHYHRYDGAALWRLLHVHSLRQP